jgi:hypothetical protein
MEGIMVARTTITVMYDALDLQSIGSDDSDVEMQVLNQAVLLSGVVVSTPQVCLPPQSMDAREPLSLCV